MYGTALFAGAIWYYLAFLLSGPQTGESRREFCIIQRSGQYTDSDEDGNGDAYVIYLDVNTVIANFSKNRSLLSVLILILILRLKLRLQLSLGLRLGLGLFLILIKIITAFSATIATHVYYLLNMLLYDMKAESNCFQYALLPYYG